jgi:nucleoside-diphosphate-sugar epimerase
MDRAMKQRTALVAGATGIVGRNTIEQLLAGGWEIVGLSRQTPKVEIGYRHIAADLADAETCRANLDGLDGITHVFYAARADREDKFAEAELSRRMLANLMDAVEPQAQGLEHVHLMHGTKWYANQNGPYKTPAKEDDPRALVPIFYYQQQDEIVARQEGKAWHWSSLRPGLICGFSVGYPHNLMTLIAVYAVVSKELGLPLRFPGSPGCYETLYQAVDADLLGRASIWAATTPECVNQAFNIHNGDYYRWESLWPRLADFFGMEAGPVQTISLARLMPAYEAVWDAAVAKYDLAPHAYADMAHWPFGDLIFDIWWDDISSIVKLRQHGFAEAMDSEQMFMDILGDFRRRRIIP